MNFTSFRNVILLILIVNLPWIAPLSYAYFTGAFQYNQPPFPKAQYAQLIQSLLMSGYTFILPRDLAKNMDQLTSGREKTAVLIHDADVRADGMNVFVSVETGYGVRSAFYLRPDGEYFTQDIRIFQSLETSGWEIGYHYDALSRSNGNMTEARTLFTVQLAYMRSFFCISSTRAHGDNYNESIDNHALYNSMLWSSLGLSDFSGVANATVIEDTHHVWTDPGTRTSLIIILCHTDWW